MKLLPAVGHKDFSIQAGEHEPGKWRARIKRVDGKAVTCGGTQMPFFFTSADTLTADDAVQLARNAIDGGFVS